MGVLNAAALVVTFLTIAMACGAKTNLDIPGLPNHSSAEAPVVRIKKQGLVRGSKAKDGDYYQYTGIPYAAASQKNRFETNLPVPTWHGIKEANVETIACPQFGVDGSVVGQEDCLVLNVYTSIRKPLNHFHKLPVMVFIHGGGNGGSGERSVYGPRRFVQDDVILVTFNYRFGLLGFMCTDEIANLGIKDAVAALEWIQANIEAFGGDPKKVTLFGESWGSLMVEFLVLSKRTKGLFGGAICQSGLTSMSWASGSDPEEKVRKAAKLLGYEGDDPKERIRFLKNANITDVVRITDSLALMIPFEFVPVSPCIEPTSNPGAVITEDPRKVIQSGDYNVVPIILGFNHDEGLLIYGTPNFAEMVRNDFLHTLPNDLQTHPKALRISDLAKKFYFGDRDITEDTMPTIVEYFTDTIYMLGSVQEARRYIRSSKKPPIYMYEFDYDGGLAYLKPLLNLSHIPGVAHGDELGYLFTQDGVSSNRTDDETTARRMVRLWTNFAKYRDPTPKTTDLLPVKWTAVTENDNYLLIGVQLSMDRKPFPNRLAFWDSIYKQFPPSLP